ncbi:Nucleoredoxin-like protein 1 [Nibea albiflora]|uniref:Nucleoredoxin-like protein 1 n=1 Tax=Nibea albiflora TaxID=240163 RepID=A0ACB7FM07_NIBAL|nr:Nucleoredoxin-like protein 1 [Nibea albiflora]
MVDLFIGRVLVRNNRNQDELDTENEIVMRLQNRILMLFFASAVLDQSEEQQEIFLRELPKKCLFLAYEDPYRRCVGLVP